MHDDMELMAAIGRMVVNAAEPEYAVAELAATARGPAGEECRERATAIVRRTGEAVGQFERLPCAGASSPCVAHEGHRGAAWGGDFVAHACTAAGRGRIRPSRPVRPAPRCAVARQLARVADERGHEPEDTP